MPIVNFCILNVLSFCKKTGNKNKFLFGFDELN